jgi:hypothetical protein
MSGGPHIRAVGREAAQKAPLDAAGKGENPLGADANESANEHQMEGALDLNEYVGEYDDDQFHDPASSHFGWVVPVVASAIIVAWTALYGWAMREELLAAANAAPREWTRWIIDWSVPVLLVCVIWLLAIRNSTAEAGRFAATASMLSRESAELETRLTVVNRELSLAREFLGAQSRELESLGRIASERISTHAVELQRLIQDNSAQVEAIGSASETALGNMTRLRDDLPVVANSARDVSNQVGNAGRTAQEQLEKLVTGFERLNAFGTASEDQVGALGKRVTATLAGFEGQLTRIEQFVTNRFDALKNQAGAYRSEINEAETGALGALGDRITMLQCETKAIAAKLRETENAAVEQLVGSKDRVQHEIVGMVQMLDGLDRQAIAASQLRVQELNDEAGRFDDRLAQRDIKFLEEMSRRQAEFETRETQASEVLAQRLADLDDALAQRREAQTEETAKLVAHSQSMNGQLDRLSALIAQISSQSETARVSLSEGLGSLGEQLDGKRKALGQTEKQLADLTEAGIRLLEIIQSGARHSREDLPAAIETAAANLVSVEQRAAALSGVMFTTSQKGHDLSDYLLKTQAQIEDTDSSIDALRAKLSEQSEDALARLQGLRGGFAKLSDESGSFATETQDALRNALGVLEAATESAFAALDQGAREKVSVLAADISAEAVAELEKALRNDSAETIGKLEQAAAHASGVGREATAQLRDQLAKVNELTSNLEQRVARAREIAEEQVGNDFARRMALITESLNSNSIDIAAALSTDVMDTAWDAYLKGDRGIFTRRAVRLIGNGEAREIAELYQTDDAFKGNVTRYIHDFEAMLRSMLSTRDGNSLGVTLLGSDMGKLYVVLAQAIERFRN